MSNNEDHINLLNYKLDILLKKQQFFAEEIAALQAEINSLRIGNIYSVPSKKFVEVEKEKIESPIQTNTDEIDELDAYLAEKEAIHDTIEETESSSKSIFDIEESGLEKFIGENLINKIGILITIIGVGIGTKYSIEHQLISPLTRIILGYLLGLGLLGFGIKLKEKYEKYSAVLVSGAMAIMYVITFTAYSMYQLFPQIVAFVLMVFFTIFTVIAALNYNKQVIAIIGLVGAYAVPFLLSDGSGRVAVLFSYMAIINIGILVVAFKKYWQILYYAAFAFTWLIYLSWFGSKYDEAIHFGLALGFATLFFAIFYAVFLAYKLIKKEKYQREDIILLLSNSFIFFGIGYNILQQDDIFKHYLGLFTLINALIHFGVSVLLYRSKLADKNLFYLVVGLVLTYITIAVPIQLNGKWITLMWIAEAAVLYSIGTSKNIGFYRKMAYPLLFLASFSMFIDWSMAYDSYISADSKSITPIINTDFLMSFIFVVGLGIINYFKYKFPSENSSTNRFREILNVIIPILFVFSLYMMFRLEIVRYWNQLLAHSEIKISGGNYGSTARNYDLERFKNIWLINYTLLFTGLWTLLNFKKIKNVNLGIFNFILLSLSILVFLTQGLYELSELRDAYLHQEEGDYFVKTNFYLIIRYISLIFLAFATYVVYLHPKQAFLKDIFHRKFYIKVFEIAFATIVLWVLSSELLQWMAIANNEQNYKLSLSIFWGVYALILVGIGIKYNKKHLRLAAITLFSVILLKLFLYDIASLNTISKTIVFVALGILLLIISFLYNKFKDLIFDDEEQD